MGQIAHRIDGEIDGPVDLAKPGAAVAGSAFVDDGEQLQRGLRGATLAVAVAERKLHALVIDLAGGAKPFRAQAAAGYRQGGQSERLGRSGWNLDAADWLDCVRPCVRCGCETDHADSDNGAAPCACPTKKTHLTPLVRASAGSLRPSVVRIIWGDDGKRGFSPA